MRNAIVFELMLKAVTYRLNDTFGVGAGIGELTSVIPIGIDITYLSMSNHVQHLKVLSRQATLSLKET